MFRPPPQPWRQLLLPLPPPLPPVAPSRLLYRLHDDCPRLLRRRRRLCLGRRGERGTFFLSLCTGVAAATSAWGESKEERGAHARPPAGSSLGNGRKPAAAAHHMTLLARCSEFRLALGERASPASAAVAAATSTADSASASASVAADGALPPGGAEADRALPADCAGDGKSDNRSGGYGGGGSHGWAAAAPAMATAVRAPAAETAGTFTSLTTHAFSRGVPTLFLGTVGPRPAAMGNARNGAIQNGGGAGRGGDSGGDDAHGGRTAARIWDVGVRPFSTGISTTAPPPVAPHKASPVVARAATGVEGPGGGRGVGG